MTSAPAPTADALVADLIAIGDPGRTQTDAKVYDLSGLRRERFETEDLMRRFLLLAMLLIVVGRCRVPGTISYSYQNGRWVPTTAVFTREDITADEVDRLENHLNGN